MLSPPFVLLAAPLLFNYVRIRSKAGARLSNETRETINLLDARSELGMQVRAEISRPQDIQPVSVWRSNIFRDLFRSVVDGRKLRIN